MSRRGGGVLLEERGDITDSDDASLSGDDAPADAAPASGSESEGEAKERDMAARIDKLKKKKKAAAAATLNLSQNERIEQKHMQELIKFAPRWFIGPFIPMMMALVNIFVGSIVLNTTPIAVCTEKLLPVYAAGSVFLAYLLIIIYGSLFIGFCKMRWSNMFTLKVVGYPYIFLAVVWNIIGTASLSAARACILTTPALHTFAEWLVVSFWMTFVAFFLVALRDWYMKKYAAQRARRAAQAERIRKLGEQDLAEEKRAREEEEKRRAEEEAVAAEEDRVRLEKEAAEAKKKALAEQYGVSSDEEESSDEDDDGADGAALPGTAES